MNVNDALRLKARDLIRAGTLPIRPADRTWGGPGSGGRCALCGERVLTEELELELQFDPDEGMAGSRHPFHVACCTAWEIERAVAAQIDAGGSGAFLLSETNDEAKLAANEGGRAATRETA